MKPKFTIIGIKDGTRATLNPSSIHEAKLAVQNAEENRAQIINVVEWCKLNNKISEKGPFPHIKDSHTKTRLLFEYIFSIKNHY